MLADGYNQQFGITLNKLTPVDIISAPKLLLADEAQQASNVTPDFVEQLKVDFDLETEGMDMVFFVAPDAVPKPVYQAEVVADASSASTSVRKMTYGVCKLFFANEREWENSEDSSVNSLHPESYMVNFLSKKMRDKLSAPANPLYQEEWDWLMQWQDNLTKTVLRIPQNGKFVNMRNDPYDQYLPAKGYIGKDRIDLLVEGKDDLGRPIAMTIRYFINVLPQKEIDKVIVNDQTYSKAIKKYCGTNKESWRISYSAPASDTAIGQGGALQSFYTQAASNLLFADLPNAALGQTTGQSITLDDNAAGHNWYIDYTPYLNEEYLPTANPNVWQARPGTEAAGKMDMLSVLLHEHGHVLGIEHSADQHASMASTLPPGTRRLPTADELALMAQLVGEIKTGRSTAVFRLANLTPVSRSLTQCN